MPLLREACSPALICVRRSFVFCISLGLYYLSHRFHLFYSCQETATKEAAELCRVPDLASLSHSLIFISLQMFLLLFYNLKMRKVCVCVCDSSTASQTEEY